MAKYISYKICAIQQKIESSKVLVLLTDNVSSMKTAPRITNG